MLSQEALRERTGSFDTITPEEGGGLQGHGHRKTATAEAGRGKEWILSYGLQGEPSHTLTLAKRSRWW